MGRTREGGGRREGGEAGAAAKATTSSSSHDMTSKGRAMGPDGYPFKLDSCTNLSSARVSGMGNNMA